MSHESEAIITDYRLLLSYEEGYIDRKTYEEVENIYNEVRAMLSAMISKMTYDS